MSRLPLSFSARARTGATVATSIAFAATLIWCGSTTALAAPASAERESVAPIVAQALPASGEHDRATARVPAAVVVAPTWSIDVDTTGYQDELNRCLWVRMDFIDVVPIVGKHNYCGGDIILTMTLGQTVHLTGLGLDGTYIVTGDRQVFSGEQATVATDKLTADVILQTCYWNKSQGMRFVTLTLLPEVPRVLVGVS